MAWARVLGVFRAKCSFSEDVGGMQNGEVEMFWNLECVTGERIEEHNVKCPHYIVQLFTI